MKMLKYIAGVSAILIIIAVSLNAQPRGRGMLHERLNLSEEQKDKIENLRSEHHKKMIDLKADLEKRKAEFFDLKRKGNYSRSDFLTYTDNLNEARQNMSKSRANHRMDVYELLTPEQKKISDERPLGKRGFNGKGHGMGRGFGMMNGCQHNNNMPPDED